MKTDETTTGGTTAPKGDQRYIIRTEKAGVFCAAYGGEVIGMLEAGI